MAEMEKKSGGPVLLFLLAFWVAGCGIDGPGTPVVAQPVDRPRQETDRRVGSNLTEKQETPLPSISAVYNKSVSEEDPETRLESMNRRVQDGDPEALAVLYEALIDPEPAIQKEAVEWLTVLVEYDPEVRPQLEAFQEKERNAYRFQYLSEVLAEPVPEWADMLAEETPEEK